MKKKLFLTIPFLLMILCCKEQTKKNYEDYNEEDFVEVQGIIIKVEKEFSYQYRKVDVTYIYNLNQETPSVGYEADSPFIPIEGQTAIVLVHKYDDGVSFIGGFGFLDEQEKILEQYLEKSEQFGVEYYGVEENLLR